VEVNILAVHADGTSLEDGDDAVDSGGSSFNDMPRAAMVTWK